MKKDANIKEYARAISKDVRISPFKLRPVVDALRGKRLDVVMALLKIHSMKKVTPIAKTVASAYANMCYKNNDPSLPASTLKVSDIRVDQGKMFKYVKPGAMGRASTIRRRFSHISVVVVRTAQKNNASQKEVL